ncbi:MAG: HTTM domain-containing protein [Planctomycetales bacterium]|nr:HTTM domain-containing protein [Planctomycetales bacterium]
MLTLDSASATWAGWLFAPIDNAFLALFRIVFGCAMLVHIHWYLDYDIIRAHFVEPQIHFTWLGFDWVRPWPGEGMYWHYHVMGFCAACIVVGFYYRVAALLFSLAFTYDFLIDQTWYQNHHYLICLLSFLLIFLPAHHRLSLDAWRRPSIRSEVTPAWTLWLLRLQLGVPYFYGGLAKLNTDWLHGRPLDQWLTQAADVPIIGRFCHEAWCVYLFAYGGLFYDLLVVPALLWKKTRWMALILTAAFHLTNAQVFEIGIFPWFMLPATFVVFFPPALFGSWFSRFRYRTLHNTEHHPHRRLVPRPVVLLFLGGYATIQLLLPLRHHLYPGSSAWTREAHHFSWRMKLNDRTVDIQYEYVDPETGLVFPVDYQQWLTIQQGQRLRNPDMFLQLARAIARDLERELDTKVEIRATGTVSINGHPPRPLIAPNVDLASYPRSLWPAAWILSGKAPREPTATSSPAGDRHQ